MLRESKHKIVIFLLVFLLIILTFDVVYASPSYEDFTTYTEVEPDDRIQKTATHVDCLSYRNEDAYLYKDKEIDHFGDFEHHVDAKSDFAQTDGYGSIWSLQNYVGNFRGGYEGGEAGVCLGFQRPHVDIRHVNLIEITGDAGGFYVDNGNVDLSVDTMYYFLVKKVGTSLVCGVYNTAELRDAGDGTDGDVDNLSLTLHSDWKFRYVYGCSSWEDGFTAYLNMDVENLDLQEEEEVLVSITFNFTEGGQFRLDNATFTNSTEYEYVNETVVGWEFQALTFNASWLFVNFTWDTSYNDTNPYAFNVTLYSNLTVWCNFQDPPYGKLGEVVEVNIPVLFVGGCVVAGLIAFVLILSRKKK